jgi:O-antigen/teichoic acid export membrane protein
MPSAAIAMALPVKDSADRDAVSPRVFDVAAEAMPFALAGVFYLVYHQIGVVLLGWMQGDEPAGIYHVALTVIAALALLPDAVFQKYLMPKTQHWAEHDRDQFLRVYRFGNGVMLASGLGLMLALGLASPTLVPWVFGDAYQDSGGVLLVLALALPFRFLSVSAGCALVTGGHMSRKNRYHGIAALTSVVLNLLLIPPYGVYGVACSSVITEAILLGLFLRGVRSHVLGSDALQGWNLRLGSLQK